MKPGRTTRRYLNPEERRQIAERCVSSGLSDTEFARRYRLSLSSLHRWLAEARNATSATPAVVLHEVTVSPSLAAPASPLWAVEIVSPDGITIRCREALSVDDLSGLLRGPRC